jgi:hypothetical protein
MSGVRRGQTAASIPNESPFVRFRVIEGGQVLQRLAVLQEVGPHNWKKRMTRSNHWPQARY